MRYISPNSSVSNRNVLYSKPHTLSKRYLYNMAIIKSCFHFLLIAHQSSQKRESLWLSPIPSHAIQLSLRTTSPSILPLKMRKTPSPFPLPNKLKVSLKKPACQKRALFYLKMSTRLILISAPVAPTRRESQYVTMGAATVARGVKVQKRRRWRQTQMQSRW